MTTAYPALSRGSSRRGHSSFRPAITTPVVIHVSIHLGCHTKEHPSCAAEVEPPISRMTSAFELCGFLQLVLECLGTESEAEQARSRSRKARPWTPGGRNGDTMGSGPWRDFSRFHRCGGSTVGEGLRGDQKPWERSAFAVDAVFKPLSPPTSRLFLCGRCRYPLLALSRWLQPLAPLNLSHIAPGGWRPPRNSSCHLPEPLRLAPPPPAN